MASFLYYDKYFKIVTLETFGVYLISLFCLTFIFIQKKKIILINFSTLFILLFIGDLVCFFVLGMPKKGRKYFTSPYLAEDRIVTYLGYLP